MSTVAHTAQIKLAADSEPFWELDRRSRPATWCGRAIYTPYFAASGFVNREGPPNSNFVSKRVPSFGSKLTVVSLLDDSRQQVHEVNYRGMLTALGYYGIPGWSSKISEK